MKKRLISLLVALCMAVTLLPVSALTAWAEESSSNSTTLRIKYGYPVGSGENHDQDCSGDDWSYDGTTKTLKLNPTSPTEYDFSSLSSDGNTLDCALEKGSINGGIFSTAPDNSIKLGYILNCSGYLNDIFNATCYVIPNTNSTYPTKITASFDFGALSPFDVTINNTQQMLLTE